MKMYKVRYTVEEAFTVSKYELIAYLMDTKGMTMKEAKAAIKKNWRDCIDQYTTYHDDERDATYIDAEYDSWKED